MTNYVPWRVTRGEVKRVLDQIEDPPQKPCEVEAEELLQCWLEKGPDGDCSTAAMLLDRCTQTMKQNTMQERKMARKQVMDGIMALAKPFGVPRRLGVNHLLRR
eukprot:g45919.t1